MKQDATSAWDFYWGNRKHNGVSIVSKEYGFKTARALDLPGEGSHFVETGSKDSVEGPVGGIECLLLRLCADVSE